MISEGSSDTEDWSNDAEDSALCHRKNYILKIQIEIIFNNTTVFSLFVIT